MTSDPLKSRRALVMLDQALAVAACRRRTCLADFRTFAWGHLLDLKREHGSIAAARRALRGDTGPRAKGGAA